jgi:hypothetical protein
MDIPAACCACVVAEAHHRCCGPPWRPSPSCLDVASVEDFSKIFQIIMSFCKKNFDLWRSRSSWLIASCCDGVGTEGCVCFRRVVRAAVKERPNVHVSDRSAVSTAFGRRCCCAVHSSALQHKVCAARTLSHACVACHGVAQVAHPLVALVVRE